MLWLLFILCSQSLQSVAGFVPTNETNALHDLYITCGGNNWLWNDLGPQWNFSTANLNPCSTSGQYWEGIKCSLSPNNCNSSEICHITMISLPGYLLRGQLPPSWKSLAYLTALELSTNLISGSIPSDFSPSLQTLSLARNQFESTLPSTIGFLTSLTSLDLSYNQITQSIPLVIGSMRALKSFLLLRNSLSSSIPHTISLLTGLETIDLSRNDLSGSLPDSLRYLLSLQSLELYRNHFTSSLPDSFSELTSLTRLNLAFNRFHGSLSSDLGKLKKLRELQLSFNQFDGSLPHSLGSLSSLLEIHLNQNNFTGPIPTSIGSLTRLKEITAPFNSFSSSLPSSFTSLSFLSFLDLSYNQLSNSLPISLGSLSRLLALKLSNNLLSHSLPSSLSSLIKLTWLDLAQNIFNGTLFDKVHTLTALNSLIVTHNQLTGPIGPSFSQYISLTGLHLSENYFSNEIPLTIGDLSTTLRAIDLATNLFHGSLPLSLSTLSSLTLLIIEDNSFSNTLPIEIQSLTQLRYFECSTNFFTGPLPCQSFSLMTAITTLRLGYNSFTGTLCTEFGSLSSLNEISLPNIFLTGTIPMNFFSFVDMERLLLNDNFLTGTIPPSISPSVSPSPTSSVSPSPTPSGLHVMTQIRFIHLQSNSLTGSLPNEFNSFSSLYQLFVNKNHFTGPVTFTSQPSHMALVNLDLSDNQLTGIIPSTLFLIPNIETIIMTSNCFQSILPSEICHASNLYVLSLDGLASAQDCPFHYKIPFTGVVLNNVLDGTIPHCIWKMKELIVLSLSSNGLTGTLQDLDVNSSLQSLTLSHNHLTGTIPLMIQTHHFLSLDLSFNQFIGGVSRMFEASTPDSSVSSTIKLEVNRLSGEILSGHGDVTKHQSNLSLNILEGNIFSCQSLPSGDQHSLTYSCGSNEFDQSIIIFTIAMALLLLLTTTLITSRYLLPSYCPRISSLFSTLWSYHTLFNSPDISSLARLLSFQQLSRLKDYGAILLHLEHSILLLFMATVALSLPLYVLKSHEAGTSSYTTHTHLYRWTWTTAYMTGPLPATLLLTLCAISCFFFSSLIFQLRNISTSYQHRDRDRDGLSLEEDEEVVSARKRRKFSHALAVDTFFTFRRYLYQLSLLFLNIGVVSTVNVLYIISTSRNLTTTVDLSIRLAVALFKLLWDGTVLSRLFDANQYSNMKLTVHLLNSIFIPCLVTAFTSPSCYRGLLISPDPITSSYEYLTCTLYVVGVAQSTCLRVGVDHVEVAPFTPPFSYNYMCGSTILSAYIPVYLYSYTFLCVFPLLYTTLLSQLPSYDTIPFPTLFGIPGIVWPVYWTGVRRERGRGGERDGKSSSLFSSSHSDQVISKQLFSTNRRLTNISKHLAVLLTFGLCCPVLAFVIALSTTISLMEWRWLLSRFILHRTHTAAALHGGLVEQNIIEEQQQQRLTLFSDSVIDCVLEPAHQLIPHLLSMVSLLLCASCVFFAFLSWDIAGDVEGWEMAYWAPVTAIGMLLLLLGYAHWLSVRSSPTIPRREEEREGVTSSSSIIKPFSFQISKTAASGGGGFFQSEEVRDIPAGNPLRPETGLEIYEI
jgi:Leucine-rich repeat (LRR) protein